MYHYAKYEQSTQGECKIECKNANSELRNCIIYNVSFSENHDVVIQSLQKDGIDIETYHKRVLAYASIK